MNKASLRVTLLFSPKARNRSQPELQCYRPYNILMMRDSPERHVILSVSGPVNNVQVKFKYENRKERAEMLPGRNASGHTSSLFERWDCSDSSSTLQTSIYFVLIPISLRILRLSLNFALLLGGVFYKPPSLAGAFSTQVCVSCRLIFLGKTNKFGILLWQLNSVLLYWWLQ